MGASIWMPERDGIFLATAKSTFLVNPLNANTAILDTILANPADDTARLVLADLLRESDAPAERVRGQFLWAGVTAARFRNYDLIDDPLYYTAHQEIAAVATAGYPARWLAELGIESHTQPERNWAWDCTHDRVTVRVGSSSSLFSRGMLSGLSVGLAEWYQLAPRVLAAEPLESIVIIDVPGLTLTIDQPSKEWRLTARLKAPAQRIQLMGGSIPTSMAPSPFLMESAADWRVEELFPTRAALLTEVTATSASLVDALHEVAGNRWPGPRLQRK
jgi:uncharacterized protein (TIGR02996 family)